MHVSSFRDRLNPEAVHFPPGIARKAWIVIGAAVILVCLAPAYWIEQPLQSVIVDSVLAAAALAFLVSAWPWGLVTDQFGVSRKSVYPARSVFIPWKEVASVEPFLLYHGFLANLGIDNEALAVYSSNGKRIVHGPEHTDRARFLHEFEIHGVVLDAASAGELERE